MEMIKVWRQLSLTTFVMTPSLSGGMRLKNIWSFVTEVADVGNRGAASEPLPSLFTVIMRLVSSIIRHGVSLAKC